MEQLTDETGRLRRCVRELAALSVLSAAWGRTGPQGIAESLAEVLLRSLPHVDFLYARVNGLADAGVHEAVRTSQPVEPPARPQDIARALEPLLKGDNSGPSPVIPNPVGGGTVRLAVVPIGYVGDCGVLVAGSRQPDFPGPTDQLLLGVAANQAAVVLQHQRSEETLRRQSELLHDERELLRVTLASIGDAVVTTDAQGRVTFLNPVAESLTGWTTTEATGTPLPQVFRVINERTRQPVENPAQRALTNGAAVGLANHTVLIARDGTERPVDDSAAPIRDASGRTVGAVLVFRDISDRKQAEERLRESEARLQAVLDHTPAIVYLVDAEGRFLLINRRWREVFGLTNEQVAGRSLHDFFPEGVADQFLQNNRKVLAAGAPFEFEETVTQEGRTHTYISVKVPFNYGAGSAPAICGISTDITERKRVEEALRASEGRFRGLMEQAPFSVQVFAPDGRTVRVNRAWEELWGVTLDQIGDYNILEDRQLEAKGILPHIRRAFDGEPVHIPAIQYDPNETIPDRTRHQDPRRWVSAVAYPLKDQGGQVREVVLVHEDITARKRAEEALLAAHRELEARVADRTAELARANEFLRALLENVQDGIVACNAEGVLTLFNHVTRELHGLPEEPTPAEEWAGRYRLYRPDGQTPMARDDVPLYRALQGERVRDVEMVIAPDNLPPRTVLTSGQAFYDGQGVKLGAVVSMHDITQRKLAEEGLRKAKEELERRVEERTAELARANEALREADRRKDEFLATLAHELRNPLAPIRNSLQILKMPRLDAATVEHSRAMMERQVQQLVRLVDDLLDVSRVMRGKVELKRERVELATVVARAVEMVQPLIEAQGHELAVALPPESLPVDADPVRLAQVVGNLLTNAAKYTEPNGRIWLTAERDGGAAVLRVRDTGIGIAPDMLPHIFELFVQVDYAATRSQGGLGIGLTLVKNLVEMHHGTVEARSEGLGKGSEFAVRLPLSAQGREEPEGPDSAEHRQVTPPPGHRLLVVDDNRDAAESLAMLLRLQGHEVRVTQDGPSALELAKVYQPEMVFLDIGMPGMDGYEVARRLRRQPGMESVRLAALTGWGQPEDRRRSAEAGFDHHLVKPVEPKALEELLAGLHGAK